MSAVDWQDEIHVGNVTEIELAKKREKPGRGWTHINGPVLEHESGIRLHIWGLAGRIGEEPISANRWPESLAADRAIRIAGGNRKRGLMIWARAVLSALRDQ